jgi:RHS repeat-associated protein
VAQSYIAYDSNGNPGTPVLTEYFMGGLYEMSGSQVKKYYTIAGMTIAMNDGNGVKYLLTDQLGSVVAISDNTGTLISQQRYLPFGGVRQLSNYPMIGQTDRSFTGQRNLDAQGNAPLGLMDYHARMYDSLLARFIQPDTIWSINRYEYVSNNPINATDPTGQHCNGLGHAYAHQQCELAWNGQGKYASNWHGTQTPTITPPTADDYCAENVWDCYTGSTGGPDDISQASDDSGFSIPFTTPPTSDYNGNGYVGGDPLSLGDSVQLIPTFSTPPGHLPIGAFFDFYGQASVGIASGQGPLNVQPDSIGYGSYAFTTEGYATADIAGGKITLGGNTIENTGTIGGKFSWETIGFEADYEQVQEGNTLLGRYEQISYRIESHPAGDAAAVFAAVYGIQQWASQQTPPVIEQEIQVFCTQVDLGCLP